jgi:hypothetical protein
MAYCPDLSRIERPDEMELNNSRRRLRVVSLRIKTDHVVGVSKLSLQDHKHVFLEIVNSHVIMPYANLLAIKFAVPVKFFMSLPPSSAAF